MPLGRRELLARADGQNEEPRETRTVAGYVLFNRKRRNAARYLLLCELAAANCGDGRIDRTGRQLGDGRRVARRRRRRQRIAVLTDHEEEVVSQGMFAAAIEIREVSVEIQENPQGYHGRAAFRLVRQ